MKVAIISEKDAANASLAKIADKLLVRKHQVDVYAPYMAPNVLAYFNPSISIYDFAELNALKCEEYDCVLTSAVAAILFEKTDIMTAQVPIFTQNYLINKQVYWRGDICYVPSLPTTVTDYDEYMHGSRIAIGEPKYDETEAIDTDSNKLLLLDSGHYPFGNDGKKALAETILNICYKFPEYEIVVKPRFLPGDVVTHTNRVHLYDVISECANGALPDNLTLLKQHSDLSTLIEESKTVICMYTTAFVGACLKGKGLAIIDNLPSDDIYDTRLKTSYRIRDYMIGSGALTDYKNIVDILPDGRKADDKYIDYLLACRDNSAEAICDSMETLVGEYYSKGLFPNIRDCNYDEVGQNLDCTAKQSWEEVIDKRLRDFILYRMTIQIDFHIKNYISVDKYYSEFLGSELVTYESYMKMLPNILDNRNKCIVENADVLMNDEIDQGILLNSLYLTGEFEKIKAFPNKTIGAYSYYLAQVYKIENDEDKCIDALIKYDEISFGRLYIREISDMPNNRLGAYILLLSLLKNNNRLGEVSYFAKRAKVVYQEIYNCDFNDLKIKDDNQKKQHDLLNQLMICEITQGV